MESFFSRYRNALVLIVVLVAQLLALAVQARRPKPDGADQPAVSLMRYVVVSVVSPPERLMHDTGLWFRSVWNGYIDLVHVRRENAALKGRIERLRLEQASIAQNAAQGLRLQRLLGFQEKYIHKTLPAQVIGTSGTNQSKVLYIDKGSEDGLKQDMAVITADGIVGKLKDVFPHTSQVLLITDPTSAAGVILESPRIRGILRGRAYGQLEVSDVSPDDRIHPGAPVVTSGGDQIFPRGLPVGTVEKVVPDPDHDPLVDILVRPAAKLSQLEEVLVITATSDTMSAQEAKDLAASEAEGKAAQQRASDILAERLPHLIDPNAPADTNPRPTVDAKGRPIKPPPPPLPDHPDRFSPGAEPAAAAMTPGGRYAPVKWGTEDRPAPIAPPPTPSPGPAKGAIIVAAAPPRSAPLAADHAAGPGTSASQPKGPAASGKTSTSSAKTVPASLTAAVHSNAPKTQSPAGRRAVVDGPRKAASRKTPLASETPRKPDAPSHRPGPEPGAAPAGGTRNAQPTPNAQPSAGGAR